MPPGHAGRDRPRRVCVAPSGEEAAPPHVQTEAEYGLESYEDRALQAIVLWEEWVRSGACLEFIPRLPGPVPLPGARARISRALVRRVENLCCSSELAALAADAALAPGGEGSECARLFAEQAWALWHGGGLGPVLLSLLLRTDGRRAVLGLWHQVDLDLPLPRRCVSLLQASLEVGAPSELQVLLQRSVFLANFPSAQFWRSIREEPEGVSVYNLLRERCWEVLGVQLAEVVPADYAPQPHWIAATPYFLEREDQGNPPHEEVIPTGLFDVAGISTPSWSSDSPRVLEKSNEEDGMLFRASDSMSLPISENKPASRDPDVELPTLHGAPPLARRNARLRLQTW